MVVGMAIAQIPNPSFEDWSGADFYDDPQEYLTTNILALIGGDPLTVLEVDGQSNSAVRLIAANDNGQIVNGVVTNLTQDLPGGGHLIDFEPLAIEIDYRSALSPGDTSLIYIGFKGEGGLVNEVVSIVSGVTSGYETATLVVPTFTLHADTVQLLIQATVADVPQAYSSIDIDEIRFMNGADTLTLSFDNWVAVGFENPDSWSSQNILNAIFKQPAIVEKEMDAFVGNYAVKISTREIPEFFGGEIDGILVTAADDPEREFRSIDFKPTSISGQYKYESIEPDTGVLIMLTGRVDPGTGDFVTDLPILGAFTQTSDYMPFQVDINLTNTPDSFALGFAADVELLFADTAQLGRVLILDDLFLNFSTDVDLTHNFDINVYPNPTSDRVTISGLNDIETDANYYILDGLGRKLESGQFSGDKLVVDLAKYRSGSYMVQMQIEGQYYFSKIVKK